MRLTAQAVISAGRWVNWCLLAVEVERGLKPLKDGSLRAWLIHLLHQTCVDFPGSPGGIPVLPVPSNPSCEARLAPGAARMEVL